MEPRRSGPYCPRERSGAWSGDVNANLQPDGGCHGRRAGDIYYQRVPNSHLTRDGDPASGAADRHADGHWSRGNGDAHGDPHADSDSDTDTDTDTGLRRLVPAVPAPAEAGSG